KMNSYGKTWHVWDTGNTVGLKGDSLPLGEPQLGWSFNRDGEAVAGLVENRDRRMGIDSKAKREARQGLVGSARPQTGVNALNGKFENRTRSITGVEDADAPVAE